MNSKRIEKMIPEAIHLIEGKVINLFIDGEEKVDSRFNGYVAAYGPTIRQTGLLSTITYYNNKEERAKINSLLLKTMQKSGFVDETEGDDLYSLVKEKTAGGSSDIRNKWKALILDAVVASKLAIKTFPIVRGEEDDS